MRTKTLLVAAAALSAGLLASSAQVYSANVVGYVNVLCPPGKYTAIANQLTNTDLTIGTILTNIPSGSQLLTWNGVNDYNYYTYVGGAGWFDGDGNPADSVKFVPGQGGLMKNNEATAFTVTFVGDVMQSATPTLTVPIGSGLSLVSSIVPVGGKPIADLQFPAAPDGLQIYKWNSAAAGEGDWTYYTLVGGDWYDADGNVVTTTFTIGVGEGFMTNNESGAPVAWSRSFTVL